MAPPTPAPSTSSSAPGATRRYPRKRYWKVPTGLILLSLVPVIAGAARITELTAGAEITEANARFFASPVPVFIHIVTASVYSILGAFQFVPSLRRGRRSWHRKSGRLLAPLGFLAALSGVWMTVFYTHPDGVNTPLVALRLFFGLAMAVSIVLGVLAVLHRDIPRHSAWMTRAYAIGLGAGTQVFTHLPWTILFGPPGTMATAILMGLGWVINVAVAEYVISRRRQRLAPHTSGGLPQPCRSYDVDMIAYLRSVWTAPAASPRPAARVWRDYALVAAVAVVVVLEGVLSPSASWPMLILVAALLPTLLWRRIRPLAMVVTVMAVTALATIVVSTSEPPIASAFFVVLLYALSRWGSGRAVIVGVAVVLVHLWVTELLTGFLLEDAVGAHVVVIMVVSLGLAVRFRSSTRSREVERARMLERERLARDVHDTVAHHVSAIAIRAQAGLATAASDPVAATDALRVIQSEASSSLTELRTMLRVLRFDDSADLHASPEIRDLEHLTRREQGGPIVDLRLTGQLNDLPSAVMTAVYRIAQESVTNARRHASRATRIDVVVDADDQQVRVNVRDDGAAGTPATPGFGVTGMKERAALLGGTCVAGPASAGGWTVEAVLPRTGRPA